VVPGTRYWYGTAVGGSTTTRHSTTLKRELEFVKLYHSKVTFARLLPVLVRYYLYYYQVPLVCEHCMNKEFNAVISILKHIDFRVKGGVETRHFWIRWYVEEHAILNTSDWNTEQTFPLPLVVGYPGRHYQHLVPNSRVLVVFNIFGHSAWQLNKNERLLLLGTVLPGTR